MINLFKNNDENSKFTDDEVVELEQLVRQHSTELEENPDNYIDVYYEIGKLFWYHYDSPEQITRAKNALTWFQTVADNSDETYQNHNIAKVYACVGAFYRDIVTSITEVGEKGMDHEGFSGRDGRTTIFDWWSVGSLRRLYKHIHGGDGLTESQKETLRLYEETLSLAADPCIEEGKTFDICYRNLDTPGFDPDHTFAFLRGGDGKAVLFVCDFSGSDRLVTVRIPPEAFEYLGINKTETLELSVSVRGFGYSVLPV